MKFEKLQPGMTVYDVGTHRMGSTTIKTVTVWDVRIISVDAESRTVTARWNWNKEKTYREHQWSKWRLNKPVTIRGAFGQHRLATREELKAIKAAQGESNE